VLPQLVELVSAIISGPLVKAFGFGLSADADGTRERRGCSRLFFLYSTDQRHEALLVEDSLESAFSDQSRFSKDDNPDEREPVDDATSYVYMAIWNGGSEKRLASV
jgi:hypothetical protein